MKFIDLFAGIGGFHYGIEKAGKAECVYANEWDKYANSVYRKHFGECDNRDIRTVDAGSIPDHDLLCAGFPCQSFSIAGKREGFEDTRGTLFFEICRILRAKRPALVLLENVKGLLSHDAGKTFYTIIRSLDDLGYDCQWQVLNSKNFGVPQNRERVFIIGHLRGTGRPEVFPFTGNYEKAPFGPVTTSSGRNRSTASNYIGEVQSGTVDHGKFVKRKDEALSIDANYYKGPENHGVRTMIKYGNSQDMKISQGLAQTLSTKNQSGQAQWDGSTTLIGTYRTHNDGKGFRTMKSNMFPTIPARAREDGSGQPVITEGMRIRRLTPVECERLQGFPDNWTKYGTDGEMSDTQRYKMCGNAVTTNVITAIVEKLFARSSMVEQFSVKEKVLGSSPSGRA